MKTTPPYRWGFTYPKEKWGNYSRKGGEVHEKRGRKETHYLGGGGSEAAGCPVGPLGKPEKELKCKLVVIALIAGHNKIDLIDKLEFELQ